MVHHLATWCILGPCGDGGRGVASCGNNSFINTNILVHYRGALELRGFFLKKAICQSGRAILAFRPSKGEEKTRVLKGEGAAASKQTPFKRGGARRG